MGWTRPEGAPAVKQLQQKSECRIAIRATQNVDATGTRLTRSEHARPARRSEPFGSGSPTRSPSHGTRPPIASSGWRFSMSWAVAVSVAKRTDKSSSRSTTSRAAGTLTARKTSAPTSSDVCVEKACRNGSTEFFATTATARWLIEGTVHMETCSPTFTITLG